MDLAFANNQSWIWTVSLSQWALLYDLTQATFRMQMRAAAGDTLVIYRWSSNPADMARGLLSYEPSSKLLTSTAPYADMAQIAAATNVYDLQAQLPVPNPAMVKIFTGGALSFSSGVTR
ncbi:hypothetical protein [Methylocella tundrae]|uniref:Uncharacterized protein n=1 Tax=Methylocella tundrae TaxID=227605 RepID=A0A4U8YX98_METTU|nr:hypothetical protein [Methylocella tundrae]WPP05522.1 hypothetical protein SIN04_06770 [Methylocella tundrae]VFU07949.1 protein of unknown function [Methylocella tundrae]